MNAAETLRAIRERRPLVHCITNDVTVGRVADALAALGALPVMASAEEEAAEMAEQAQALLLNLGTPRAERWRAAAENPARIGADSSCPSPAKRRGEGEMRDRRLAFRP